VRRSDVPAGPLVIDTDVLSYITWKQKRHGEFAELIDGHLLAVSFVSIGEIRARTYRAGSVWSAARRTALDAKLNAYVVLTATNAVVRVYSELHARFLGRVGTNDLWIAATALGQPTPAPVVTNNVAHFDSIAAEFRALVVIHPDK
jgi:predicted nucleic acid-binding protein